MDIGVCLQTLCGSSPKKLIKKEPIQPIFIRNMSSKLLLKGPAKFLFCNQNIAFEG